MVTALGATAVQAGTSGAIRGGSEDNQQLFLKLLMVQLQNQDPLEPLKNEDFLAQLAQFESLEQQIALTNQNKSILLSSTLASASNLLDRQVSVMQPNGELYEGSVDSIVLSDGVAKIVIDGEEYNLSDVLEVK